MNTFIPLLANKGLTYTQKVKNIFGSSLIGYWPMNEPSGSVAYDRSGNGRNGTYGNVTLGQPGIGDGNTCPLFNSSTDYLSIYSTGLRDAFNGDEGTFSCWFKIANVGVWVDGSNRHIFYLAADANNEVFFKKKSTATRYMQWWQRAGSTTKSSEIVNVNPTSWIHCAITWSRSGNFVKGYLNGVQYGSTQTLLGTWAGALALHTTVIGNSVDNGAGAAWSGWLAHAAIGNAALTEAQIQRLAHLNWNGFDGLMLHFDDEDASLWDGYLYMEGLGIKGTMYVCTNNVGTGGYLTSANLVTMHDSGWAICNHTSDHTILTTLSEANQEIKINDAITALTGWGLSSAEAHHLAYPNGGWNADTITAMTNLSMLTGRATSSTGFPSMNPEINYPFVFYYNLALASTVSLADLQAAINAVRVTGGYCIILFHRLVAAGAAGNQWLYSQFYDLMDWIISEGIPTPTVSEYYALCTR